MINYNMTAATLKALLCFINSGVTPSMAYDKDELTEPLIKKIENAVGDRAGTQHAGIMFGEGEDELHRQFTGCAKNIQNLFSSISRNHKE